MKVWRYESMNVWRYDHVLFSFLNLAYASFFAFVLPYFLGLPRAGLCRLPFYKAKDYKEVMSYEIREECKRRENVWMYIGMHECGDLWSRSEVEVEDRRKFEITLRTTKYQRQNSQFEIREEQEKRERRHLTFP